MCSRFFQRSYLVEDQEKREGAQGILCEFHKAGVGRIQLGLCIRFRKYEKSEV